MEKHSTVTRVLNNLFLSKSTTNTSREHRVPANQATRGRESPLTASKPLITLSISHLHDSSRCTSYHGVRSAGACTSEPFQDVERLPMPCDKLLVYQDRSVQEQPHLPTVGRSSTVCSSTALRFSMGKPPACTTTAIDISAVPALCA
jgi:hypothetical protein